LIGWADRLFAITVVEITDGRKVSREEVLTLLDLAPGRGLIGVDVGVLERAVKTHPWIRSAQVRRVFPHTLVVDVEEREPVAVLRTGGRTFLVDKDGALIVEGIPGADEDLPSLSGVDYVGAVLGAAATVARVRSGIALAGLLNQTGAGRTEVDLHTPGDLVAYYSGFRLRFGDGPFEDKVDRYRRVSDRVFDRWGGAGGVPAGRGVEVDLRFRDRIIVRERG
jgi:cell division protein FtsQ